VTEWLGGQLASSQGQLTTGSVYPTVHWAVEKRGILYMLVLILLSSLAIHFHTLSQKKY